jgi:Dullard-like phosphatase family protein
MSKLQHHRNLSTSSINNISKNILPKREESTKLAKPKNNLFNINSNSIDQLSSYGTKEKEKNKEKEKEKENSDKDTKSKEEKDEKKIKSKKNKPKAKSQKNLISQNSKENSIKAIKENEFNNNNNENIEENNEIVIIRKLSGDAEEVENYIKVPFELNAKLEMPELYIVNPNKNIEGNYSHYINGVANSLKEFLEFDYDIIFDKKNEKNIKYFYYTSPMDIRDTPKKKLLLIDLDETLIHSEFRSKENYRALDLLLKKSKCHSQTFSYSDENYIYYVDVFFRPHLKKFLKEVSKFFHLAIFTAAMKTYADIIIDYIDPKNEFFQFRLYRDACIPIQERLYIKDLRIIKDYDPMNVILMDNSLYSFMNQPSNGMLVNSFFTNHRDNQLISAKNFLINHIYPCDDIRKECEKWYHFTNLFYKGTSKEVKQN